MTLWARLRSLLRQEARDVTDELGKLRDKLDRELTRREREMSASPAEKLDMILEDIESDNQRLETLERELSDPPIEADAATRRPRLLGPTDVSSSPHLQTALGWVTALSGSADHKMRIDAPRMAELRIEDVRSAVEAYPLVLETEQEVGDTLSVQAPTLHPEDVRLIVAGAIADQVSDETDPDEMEEELRD